MVSSSESPFPGWLCFNDVFSDLLLNTYHLLGGCQLRHLTEPLPVWWFLALAGFWLCCEKHFWNHDEPELSNAPSSNSWSWAIYSWQQISVGFPKILIFRVPRSSISCAWHSASCPWRYNPRFYGLVYPPHNYSISCAASIFLAFKIPSSIFCCSSSSEFHQNFLIGSGRLGGYIRHTKVHMRLSLGSTYGTYGPNCQLRAEFQPKHIHFRRPPGRIPMLTINWTTGSMSRRHNNKHLFYSG